MVRAAQTPPARRHRRTVLAAALIATATMSSVVAATAHQASGPAITPPMGSAAIAANPAPLAPPRTAATSPVVATITATSSPVLTPRSPWQITGILRNTTNTPIAQLSVTAGVDWQNLDEGGIEDWLASTRNPSVPRWAQQNFSGVFPPGATVPFTLSANTAGLRLPTNAQGFGPRGLRIAITGATGRTVRTLGSLRSAVVWQPRTAAPTISLAPVVALTPNATASATEPAQFGAAVARTWAADRARLVNIMTATRGLPEFSWAINPSIFMTQDNDSETTALTAPLVNQLKTATAHTAEAPRSIYALPCGDVDIAAVVGTAPGILPAAEQCADHLVNAAVGSQWDTTVAWPADGALDNQSAQQISQIPGRSIIVSDTRVDRIPRNALAHLSAGNDSTTAIVTNNALGASIAALGSENAAAATLESVARLAAAARQHDEGVVVAALPRTWQPQPQRLQAAWGALSKIRWIQPVALRDVRNQAPDRDVSLVAGPAVPPTISHATVQDIQYSLTQFADFQPALVDQEALTPPRNYAFALTSHAWRERTSRRGATRDIATASEPLLATAQAFTNGISVAAASNINFLTRTGSVPVTVTNTLPYGVRVWLRLRPNSARLAAPGKAVEVQLAPASAKVPARTTKQIPVTALANGEVNVGVQLTTRPNDAASTVNPTSPSILIHIRREWSDRPLIIAGLGLLALFLLGLVRSMLRGGRRRLSPSSAPDPDDIGLVPTSVQPDAEEEGAGKEPAVEDEHAKTNPEETVAEQTFSPQDLPEGAVPEPTLNAGTTAEATSAANQDAANTPTVTDPNAGHDVAAHTATDTEPATKPDRHRDASRSGAS